MARTMLIGLRREPQPPMPIVMPSRSSRDDVVLGHPLVGHVVLRAHLRDVGVALGDEGVAVLVGHARQVELEREALLEAVGALHVARVDAVERLLGRADHRRALRRDLAGDLEARRRAARRAATTSQHRAEVRAARRRWRWPPCRPSPASCAAGTSRARCVAAPSAPRSTSGRPKVASSLATITMSALPTRPMPPPRQKPLHRGDHRHRALVDRGEGGEAAPVGADQGVEALGGLHLLDVDAGVEALALGPQDDDADRGVLAEPRSPCRPARTSRRRSAR